MLDLARTGSFADGLAAERESLHTIMGSPNQREAASAALENRPPSFDNPSFDRDPASDRDGVP